MIKNPRPLFSGAADDLYADNVIGSSTALVALFDGLRHQLHFSNLGDCGIIVLRHIDSDVAGALKRLVDSYGKPDFMEPSYPIE